MAFLLGPIGRIIMVLVIIGSVAGLGYAQHLTIGALRGRLDGLEVKTAQLQEANDNLVHDMAMVQKLQEAANQSLQTIRLQAAASERNVQHRRFTSDPRTLQQQVNQETADAFGRLGTLSRDP